MAVGDTDALASRVLVGLGAAHGQEQAAGLGLDVGEGEVSPTGPVAGQVGGVPAAAAVIARIVATGTTPG